MKRIETILVTTDFSDTSAKALPVAREMADKFGARIVLATVEEGRLPPLIIEYANVTIEEIEMRQKDNAREELAAIVQGGELGPEDRVETKVALGVPHVEILRIAEETKADLIVMATHGRGFISHAVLGSTTERVLRRAHCPVLAVRGS